MTMPLVLLAGVLMTVVTIDGAALEYRAARERGTMGSFTARKLDCSGRGPCYWQGVYVSAHGTKPNAWIFGYASWELSEGDQVSALDAGHDVKVFRPGYYDLVGVLMMAGLSLAILLLPAYLLWRTLRKRPPKPPRWRPARPTWRHHRL
ncbi:hypothetical protein [Nonomuraea sp. SYSU D8015]|uniref:hypothetical protein n=1 Tax=Nonomuraea sp. SYSU D8015 TaxID=2593644 RepID=UPI001660359F|nr:hypothetical protein [Nonomuraea sp. SYSU D8015]